MSVPAPVANESPDANLFRSSEGGGRNPRASAATASSEARTNRGAEQTIHGFTRRVRPIPPKLYRIGELVEYSGVSRQTIHNYTTMGLLTESRWTEGGHRLYDETIFERLDQIADLRAQRKSLEFIRTYFTRLDSQ